MMESDKNPQRQFDFPRAAKLAALDVVDIPLKLSPNEENLPAVKFVRPLLRALDSIIRDKAHDNATMNALAKKMSCSPKSAQRAVHTAELLGLLSVTGVPTDGRSNTYRINWNAIFDLPGAPVKVLTPPVRQSRDPGQPVRGPRSASQGTPVRLTGVSAPDKERHYNDTERQAESRSVGEVLKSVRDEVTLVETAKPKQPVWCGSIDPGFDDRERHRLFSAACSAGHLTNCPRDRVRLLAAALHAKTRPPEMATGWFKTRIEQHDWHMINRKHMQNAIQRLRHAGLELTAEDMAALMPKEPLETR